MAEKKLTGGLIEIKKGDEVLKINPKMWPQHQALGWELVDPDALKEEAAPKESASKAPEK